MRLRHVKGSEEKLNNSNYIIKEPTKYKGKYSELFNNTNKIQIEIGCGKGNFIVTKAINNPDINYIAIEKQASVLVKVLDKIDNLPNLKIIFCDAIKIDEVFDKEIDTLYLNFSDPWPKNRHANRRLTSPIFLNKYEHIFKNECKIEMKTDNRNLFEYTLITLSEANYKLSEVKLDLYANLDEDNIQTEYEAKFVSKGMVIYKLKAHK